MIYYVSEIASRFIPRASNESSIMDIRQLIGSSAERIVIIEDKNRVCSGLLTDGDLRRMEQAGQSLENYLTQQNYIWAGQGKRLIDVYRKCQKRHSTFVPRLDLNGRFVGGFHLHYTTVNKFQSVRSAYIPAGGLGERLRPITEFTPKSMVPVGDVAMLERLLIQLDLMGLQYVYISVNYLGEIIKEWLQNNKDEFSFSLEIIEETERSGTVGSLLSSGISEDVLVVNSDILFDADLSEHEYQFIQNKLDLAVLTREYRHTVPYGCIRKSSEVFEVVEKPDIRFEFASGIYFLSSRLLQHFQMSGILDMPSLINMASEFQLVCSSQSLLGKWIDIGTHEKLREADAIFQQ